MARWAPTPLAPMPAGSLVAAAASTPPYSLPSRPIWPMASIEGAPCWPLHSIFSAAKESWSPSLNMPRVLPCVAASAIENGGFTEAMGDFESQMCERSMTRALAIAASRVCARESFAKADVVPQATLNPTTTARQGAPKSVTLPFRSGLNMSSSWRQIMQSSGKASQAKRANPSPASTIDSPSAARQNRPDGEAHAFFEIPTGGIRSRAGVLRGHCARRTGENPRCLGGPGREPGFHPVRKARPRAAYGQVVYLRGGALPGRAAHDHCDGQWRTRDRRPRLLLVRAGGAELGDERSAGHRRRVPGRRRGVLQ